MATTYIKQMEMVSNVVGHIKLVCEITIEDCTLTVEKVKLTVECMYDALKHVEKSDRCGDAVLKFLNSAERKQ